MVEAGERDAGSVLGTGRFQAGRFQGTETPDIWEGGSGLVGSGKLWKGPQPFCGLLAWRGVGVKLRSVGLERGGRGKGLGRATSGVIPWDGWGGGQGLVPAG